jgi:tetratricopeptide (TPR) repeat protein
MSDPLSDALPQDSDGQRLGRLADKALHANHPDAWMLHPLSGDDDVGYDFQVQVISGSRVTDVFRAQLKGVIEPSLNAERTHYSVTLKLSTVNYYARATEPVLLVLCDLGSAPKAKDCRLYYCWIHDELERIRGTQIKPDQKTVTFHIPAINRLDDATDLSEDLARFRAVAQVGEGIAGLLKETGLSVPERTVAITRVVPNLARRSSALMTALVDEGQTSWVQAPEGSLPWSFQQADAALRVGDRIRCRAVLENAQSALVDSKVTEQADFWHLRGRLASLEADDIGANAAFAKALELNPHHTKHQESWGESELHLRWQDGSSPDFSGLRDQLTSEQPAIQALKARLTAAEGHLDDALRVAEAIKGIDGDVAQAIVLSLQYRWHDVISICTQSLAAAGIAGDRAALPLLTLRARAHFFLALHIDSLGDGDIEVSISGPPDADTTMLHSAWDDVTSVVPMLRAQGWPPRVEGIADLWANTAVMLGLHESVLPVMEEASDAQPGSQSLQAGTELVAFHAANFSVALKANARMADTDKSLLRRVTLLHLADRHGDCVALMASLPDANTSDPYDRVRALSSAILSAERLARSDLATDWRLALEGTPEAAPALALDRYRDAVVAAPLVKDHALTQLIADYEKLDRPIMIARILLYELDGTRRDHAETLLLLAERLKQVQFLDVRETLAICQALSTLRQWNEVLILTDAAAARFTDQDRLHAVGALALDRLGRSAEARDRLRALIVKPNPDSLALNTYISLATVSGFTDEAIASLESVLATETSPAGKFRCLKHLYGLLQVTEPTSPRLLDIAWRLGQLADPENEAQEGAFLMTLLGATVPVAVELSDAQKREFQQRMDAFTERFPNSKLLRRYSLPDTTSGMSILRAIESAIGITPEGLRVQARIRNRLMRGQLEVPYAWRPGFILTNIPDVPALLDAAKSSSRDRREVQLTMAIGGWSPASLAKMDGKVPLLDMTALVIIHDLDLFDILFRIFPTIAVGKSTLIELQRLMSPLSMSPSRDKCRAIHGKLKANFSRLEQPSADAPREDSFLKERWASQEVVELVQSNTRYVCYSDDVVFRIYATDGDSEQVAWCTLDLLIAADDLGLLSAAEVAQCIAQLCLWRVDLVILGRYQEAVLPAALASARDLRKAASLLSAEIFSNALLTGIWDFAKPFSDLQNHIGAFLLQLIEDPDAPVIRAAAVLDFWITKVRLHPQAPSHRPHRAGRGPSIGGGPLLERGQGQAAVECLSDRNRAPLWRGNGR